MGQVALGFRSLLFRLAVFFVMAALLAWALGGTLFPKPQRTTFDSVQFDEARWFWRLSLGGSADTARWEMIRASADQQSVAWPHKPWRAAAGPVVAGGQLYYAGLDSQNRWMLVYHDGTGGSGTIPLPDRLAVEQQLARLQAGLPLQDAQTITAQRAAVLDPGVLDPGVLDPGVLDPVN